MSAHNILTNLQELVAQTALDKAAAATLTDKEVMTYFRITGSGGAMELDLPEEGTGNKGAICLISNIASGNLTVQAPNGFGDAGSGTDKFTLAQGDSCLVWSDGTYWHGIHHTTGG